MGFFQKNDLKHFYSHTLLGKRIVILGPLPPPLGGVSVHVQRVIAKLKAQACDVFHFDTCVEYRYRFFYLYMLRLVFFLLIHRPEQVHLHTLYLSNGLKELEYLVFMRQYMHYEIILIEHDCRYLYKKEESWKNRLNKLMPHISDHVYIGDLTAKSFEDNGIIAAAKTSVEAAFLPPSISEEQKILATYPQELFSFLDRHYTIMLANAFALSLLNDKDLYGFDLCIRLLKTLHKKRKNIGLVFVLGQIGDTAYFDLCKRMIGQYELHEHIFILTGQRELWPLMKYADLFLRPTLSDGASVSVHEALWCGVPVVASDICVRPPTVILFKAGDEQDFQRAVEQHLFSAQMSVVEEGSAKIDHISN